MRITGDDRGQSVQIGVVLLFGFLIVGLSIYQATVVPEQNAKVEFDHSLAVQRDLQQLRNSVVRPTADAEPLPQAVALGTSYPNRIVAVNPGLPAGTLRTTDPFDVGVTGTNAIDRSACPGQSGPNGAQSRLLTYRIDYNEYAEAPVLVYENTVAYKQFVDPATASADDLERGTLPMTGQRLVDGDHINLLAVVGDYDESGATVATVEPHAGTTRRTAVTDPTIELPTRMSADEWRELLDGTGATVSASGYDPVGTVELQFSGDYVVDCTPVSLSGPPAAGTDPGTTQADLMTDSSGNPKLKKGELTFPIQNAGSSQVSVVGFSVSGEKTDHVRASGDTHEVQVDAKGQVRDGFVDVAAGPPGSGFRAGVEYDFLEDGDDGQTAVLANGKASITLDALRNETDALVDYGNLEFTTPDNAVVSVTLRFGDGSAKTFYFRPK